MAAMTSASSRRTFRSFRLPLGKSCAALAIAVALAAPACAAPVDSVKAPFHVGESVMVCGGVAQVAAQKKRTLLNLGAPYPNEHVAVLVWNNDLPGFEKKFGRLSSLDGKRVCAHGTIESYKDHLFIPLKNPSLLRLMK